MLVAGNSLIMTGREREGGSEVLWPMWAAVQHTHTYTSITTQDRKSSRWHGDYFPSIPTPASTDWPLKLCLHPCHFTTVCASVLADLVCLHLCPHLVAYKMVLVITLNGWIQTRPLKKKNINKISTSASFCADLLRLNATLLSPNAWQSTCTYLSSITAG